MENQMINKKDESCTRFVARKSMALFLVVMVVACSVFSVSAAETVISYDDFSAVFEGLTGQISASTIIGVLAAVVGTCVGLVFMWWGLRKVVSMLMAAFRKGKVSV